VSDPVYEKIGDPDVKVIEECAELIQAICKARRFGWDNHHPEKSPEHTNAQVVWEEMEDVFKRCRELQAKLISLGLGKIEGQKIGRVVAVEVPDGVLVQTEFGSVLVEASLRAGVTVTPDPACAVAPAGFSGGSYYVVLRKKAQKPDGPRRTK
jgi:hypothetical protein